MLKVSVVIPAYNEEEYLPKTLDHAGRALSNIPNFSEIIVVDNDSTDDTSHIAESFGARVFKESKRSISKVRNTGAANAAGDVLIFIDADTQVPPTLFQRIIEVMEDQECFGGAVAVKYTDPKRKWMKALFRCWAFWGTVFNMKQGAAQFCRKSAFEQLRGYDPTVYVGEDVEFYWRLTKFAKQNKGYLYFVEEPKVTTSMRRFDKMSVLRLLVVTNPIFILLAWRKKSVWKDWYENAVR